MLYMMVRINPGDEVVIRYEGPKGGPGMREMLNVNNISLFLLK